MRSIITTVIILNVCLCLPLFVAADEAAHREAVEALFKVLGMEKAHERGMEQMLAIQIQQNPQTGLFKDVQEKFFAKHMSWESLKDEFIAVFMEEFSEEEIRDMIVFYKTPTGQKTIKKIPVLMSKGARLQTRRIRENMPELEQMIQEESDRRKANQNYP